MSFKIGLRLGFFFSFLKLIVNISKCFLVFLCMKCAFKGLVLLLIKNFIGVWKCILFNI